MASGEIRVTKAGRNILVSHVDSGIRVTKLGRNVILDYPLSGLRVTKLGRYVLVQTGSAAPLFTNVVTMSANIISGAVIPFIFGKLGGPPNKFTVTPTGTHISG